MSYDVYYHLVKFQLKTPPMREEMKKTNYHPFWPAIHGCFGAGPDYCRARTGHNLPEVDSEWAMLFEKCL